MASLEEYFSSEHYLFISSAGVNVINQDERTPFSGIVYSDDFEGHTLFHIPSTFGVLFIKLARTVLIKILHGIVASEQMKK